MVIRKLWLDLNNVTSIKGECSIINGLILAKVVRSWAMLLHESSLGDSIRVDI